MNDKQKAKPYEVLGDDQYVALLSRYLESARKWDNRRKALNDNLG